MMNIKKSIELLLIITLIWIGDRVESKSTKCILSFGDRRGLITH